MVQEKIRHPIREQEADEIEELPPGDPQRDDVLDITDRVLAAIDEATDDDSDVDEIADEDDGYDGSRLPLHRHPSIPHNLLGVRYLDPEAFGGDEDLRLSAIAIEEDRGRAGFAPNAVRSVFDQDGALVAGALYKVVGNYRTWKPTQ